MSARPSFLPSADPEPLTADNMAHLAHVEAWLAGKADLDLPALAAHVAAGGDPGGEIEELLTADLGSAIFAAGRAGASPLSPEARALHGLTSPPMPVSPRWLGLSLAELRAERWRLDRAWQAALAAADYRADKLAELDEAPDAATAADAVARWNLLEARPRLTAPLAAAEPPGPLPRASNAELHAAVLAHVARFFSLIDAEDNARPRMLLTAETGSRKTGIALAHLRTVIEARKQANRPHRFVMMVPAHRLGREIEQRALTAGINASLFLGRGDQNKSGPQPCRNLEAVALARQAGADVRTAVCGPDSDGGRCGFRDSCEYFAGLERAKQADLVIVAHNFLFEPLPAELKHDLAGVVVDEDFAALADHIFQLTLDTLAPETLAHYPVMAEDGSPDTEATAELQRLHGMISEAARTCIGGYLTADALRAAGFTAMSGAAERTRALNWRRKRPVQMRPGMDMQARQAAARLAAVNGQLRGIAALTHALDAILTGGPAAAGRVSADVDMRRSGSQTVLTVRGQREPAAWLAELPVLMLNGTGRIEDVRRVFPDAQLAETPRAAWPHVEVRQIIGGFGRSTLGRHPTRLAELRDFITLATLGQQSALVVTHKNCEDAFAGMAGIATAHHGDIAGIDRHADVDSIFVIGGAFADPGTMERKSSDIASIAAARGGGAVAVAKPERVTRAALLTSGAAVAVECMAYVDPAAEAVHRGIYDASMVQAIGRIRPLERTADRPAVVWVFGNVALPFPVIGARHWRDARMDRLLRMVAHGAVWLNAEDMHAFEGDLFRSPKAAEHVRGRLDDAREAVAAVCRSDLRPWARFLYQLPGQGRRLREVVAPAAAVAAIKATVEAEHGDLADWQALPFTPGQQVPPAPGKTDTYRESESTSPELPAELPIRPPESGTWRLSRPPDG